MAPRFAVQNGTGLTFVLAFGTLVESVALVCLNPVTMRKARLFSQLTPYSAIW